MQFDSTHEYNFKDADLYYCEDHEGLIVVDYSTGNCQRLMIEGIDVKTMRKFASKYYKESLSKELTKDSPKKEELENSVEETV